MKLNHYSYIGLLKVKHILCRQHVRDDDNSYKEIEFDRVIIIWQRNWPDVRFAYCPCSGVSLDEDSKQGSLRLYAKFWDCRSSRDPAEHKQMEIQTHTHTHTHVATTDSALVVHVRLVCHRGQLS